MRQSRSPTAFSPRCSLNPPVHLPLTRTNPAALILIVSIYFSFFRIDSPSSTCFPKCGLTTNASERLQQQSWAMTALPPNISSCCSSTMVLPSTESPLNLTAAAQAGPDSGQSSLAPLCTVCCCGFLNRLLAVVFMVSLTFAIVVGNVVTLIVFVQTRQSRTPQGYLKGKCVSIWPLNACLPHYSQVRRENREVNIRHFCHFNTLDWL